MTELYLAMVLFAFSTSITPGPNNMLILSSGLNHGVKRSLPHLLGIAFGFPVMIIMIGIGLGTVFERWPVLHEIIKVLGVLYMLYLAWMIATSKPKDLAISSGNPMSFWQAFFFQWVNPKGWIMALGAIAAYTSLSHDMIVQAMIIALVFLLVGPPCTACWLVLGASLKHLLQKPHQQRIFNVTMALLLVASIAPIIQELWIRWL